MMSANKLSISLQRSRCAGRTACGHITSPVSGTVISGFKVKPGMGGIQVHMPAVMETTWPYPAGDRMGRGEKTDHRSIPKVSFDPPVSVYATNSIGRTAVWRM